MDSPVAYMTLDTPQRNWGRQVGVIIREEFQVWEITATHYVIRRPFLFFFTRRVEIPKDSPNIHYVWVYPIGET